MGTIPGNRFYSKPEVAAKRSCGASSGQGRDMTGITTGAGGTMPGLVVCGPERVPPRGARPADQFCQFRTWASAAPPNDLYRCPAGPGLIMASGVAAQGFEAGASDGAAAEQLAAPAPRETGLDIRRPAARRRTSMMKVAYICEPQIGGTYTSFRQVRDRLLRRSIDYRCVPPLDRQEFAGSRYEHDAGVDFLDYPDREPAGMAQRLVRHLVENNFSAMVVLPGCYPWVSSLPPYLPREIRCLARLPHNARGVYWPTAALADHFNRIIAVAPRLKHDLTSRYGVAGDQVVVIANGVDTDQFTPGAAASPRRAIYVGRIEDYQKNVFLLPKILGRALSHDSGARLTVAGSGPDLHRLRRRFRACGLEESVEFPGRVEPGAVADLLRRHGVFIMPSRFEGSSNATLEAMASGCVPLLSRLPGITDEMVVDPETGFLFAPADWKGAGDAWGGLMRAEAQWQKMHTVARERAVTHFSLDHMAAAYADLFRQVLAAPDPRPAARPLGDFIVDPRLGPTWRRWLPAGLKKRVRTWAARFGVSP